MASARTDRESIPFMKKSRFLISSLLAAGIAPANSAHAAALDGVKSVVGGPDPDEDAMIRKFAQDHIFYLAQHRSHSSHASHSSHRSGTSGRQRAPVYTPPAPRVPRTTPSPAPRPTRNERSTPPSSILPSSPATTPQSLYSPSQSEAASPSRDQIADVVRKVQMGLMAYGYYDGVLDGVVGPKTREALTRFQTDYNLKVTGTITPEVLDAFRVVAQ